MGESLYKVGTQVESWNGGIAQSLMFIVTEDCNLRCKYCYITHKASNKRMNFTVAKKFIDYILSGNVLLQEAVVLDFIGGEPFLEIELIDKICDYFKLKTYMLGISWYWNYRISVCTNGINYTQKEVQEFIEKNKNKISVTITIDGIKEKHDMQRVFPDGSGSFDIVKSNVDIWKKQFVGSTKVTFANKDLKYLKESIIYLWDEGIPDISANVVYENVWEEGDDLIYENQLIELADYILENHLFDKYVCSLFDDSIGEPYTEEILNQTSCGAGKMLAVGVDGKIYPCMRYCSYSLDHKEAYVIGDVDKGIDLDKVRPFQAVTYKMQSDQECLHCPVATGCSFCQGFNYDMADTPTNFQRAKYICKMHKARVRANNYYFDKLYNMYGIERKTMNNEVQTLNFLLSDNYVTCCMGVKGEVEFQNSQMEKNVILEGLQYARKNFYKPVFIHSKDIENLVDFVEFENFRILHIVPGKYYAKAKKIYKDVLPVYEKEDMKYLREDGEIANVILNVDEKDIKNLFSYLKEIWKFVNRINVNIIGLNKSFDLAAYKKELVKAKKYLVQKIKDNGRLEKEINILTDILFMKQHVNCGAGEKSFTLGTDGKLYICPAFYSDNGENAIGNIKEGIINLKNAQLYKMDYAPLCKDCDAYQCADCIYHNKKYTSEVNIPASMQCKKSWTEKAVAAELQEECKKDISFLNNVEKNEYGDPMVKLIVDLENTKLGFYPR